MKPRILIQAPVLPEGLSLLHDFAEVIYPSGNEPFTLKQQLELLPNCHGLLSIFNQPVSAQMIASAP